MLWEIVCLFFIMESFICFPTVNTANLAVMCPVPPRAQHFPFTFSYAWFLPQHRHQSLSRSGQRSGSRNGHTSSGLWRGHSSVPLSGHSETLGSDHSESQLSGHASSSHSRFSSTGTTTTTTTTTSNSPSSWNSWENTPDQNNHWSVDDPPIPPPAPPNTSSGGSRSMPYFQKLLSNLEVRRRKTCARPTLKLHAAHF